MLLLLLLHIGLIEGTIIALLLLSLPLIVRPKCIVLVLLLHLILLLIVLPTLLAIILVEIHDNIYLRLLWLVVTLVLPIHAVELVLISHVLLYVELIVLLWSGLRSP